MAFWWLKQPGILLKPWPRPSRSPPDFYWPCPCLCPARSGRRTDHNQRRRGAPPLYAPAEQGGVHHFLLVTAQGDNVEISCQPVPTPQDQSGLLLLTGRESREFTPADLEALGTVTGESCFQNQFGNFSPRLLTGGSTASDSGGAGGRHEAGRCVSGTIGGRLCPRVFFRQRPPGKDGLGRPAGRSNTGLGSRRGKSAVLAGRYRLVFLPPDGTYSNKDCWQTSDPGPGWHQYPSAGGARWVRNVVQLKVNSHPSRTWQANRI